MYTLQEPDHGKRRYVLVKMRPNIAMATHSNAIKRYWKPTPVSSWIKNETFDCVTAALWACVFVCTCGADFSSTMNNRHWEKSVFLLWAVYDTRVGTPWVVAPSDSLTSFWKTLYWVRRVSGWHLSNSVCDVVKQQQAKWKEKRKYWADRSKLSS